MATLSLDETATRYAQPEVLANEVRTEVKGSIVGGIGILGAIAYMAHSVGPAASLAASAWFIFMALVMAVWFGGAVAFRISEPDDRRILGFWIPFAKALMRLCVLGISASVWILLPPADENFRSFLLILYVWFLVMQVLLSTEATRVTSFAIVLILGSLTLFAQAYQVEYRHALSAFFILFGCTMWAANRYIRRAVLEATAARLDAERSSLALGEALRAVAAERDAKVHFLAAASHDLQQPIGAARLFFERAVEGVDLEGRRRAVSGARSAFASVEKLLESMLVHLRLGSGEVRPSIVPIDVDRLLAEVAAEYGAAAEAAAIKVSIRCSGLVAAGDEQLLRRAVANLLSNAIRHSGGARILVCARRAAGRTIGLWVLDDGHGIPPAESTTIFEDYRQGSGGAPGGFGIGLSSARRMIAIQGGEIGLDARWRNGSAFYIRLPEAARDGRQADRCEAA